MTELAKKYLTSEIEKKWQQYWQENEIYKWDANASREESYVIDTPPPTVSGMLHMGHVFSYVQADFVARYQRMKGKSVYYPMGFDDNGLPTERLVEKVKKVKGSQLERAEFIKLCSGISQEARVEFRELFNLIALSVDWDEEYHTISDHTRHISQASFLDLYHKNFTERKYEPCYWDPVDQTALSQADIEDKELASHMNYINFKVADTEQQVTIATTRPELIPACMALFVHPDDARYSNIIGKMVKTALFDIEVPILADHNVAIDKGTGAVMCCSFGDMTDVMWWKEHKLEAKVILNKYGKIKDLFNNDSPEYDAELINLLEQQGDIKTYQKYYDILVGKKVTVARQLILDLLQQEALLVKQEAITHPVKSAERSGAPIEIMLTKQWFIKILDKKDILLQRANEVKWHPKYMKSRLEQWINGLKYDWCISRQRFFGVPFPIWYIMENDEVKDIIIAPQSQLPVDPLLDIPQGYELKTKIASGHFIVTKNDKEFEIMAESDVMDTWATSSVSPQISSHAINTEYGLENSAVRHQKLFPADLRPQAHEIIRSWAFYTIVKAQLHQDTIPWHNMMISGWCLASDKTKMSKSKGNVITPLNLINEKGTDAVRYWAANSHLGSDTAYSEDVLAVGKKLLNKLWNAAKFCKLHFSNLMQAPDSIEEDVAKGIISHQSDLWLLTNLSQTIKAATNSFEQYEYAKAMEHIEYFFWHYFCDNYLEISKARAYGDKEILLTYDAELTEQQIIAGQISAITTIYHVFGVILKLFAPFLPHISEELYQNLYEKKSIHSRGMWPSHASYPDNKDALAQGEFMLQVIDLVRKEKSDNNFSIKKEIAELEINIKEKNKLSNDIIRDLCAVCNAKKIKIIDSVKLAQCQIDLRVVYDS